MDKNGGESEQRKFACALRKVKFNHYEGNNLMLWITNAILITTTQKQPNLLPNRAFGYRIAPETLLIQGPRAHWPSWRGNCTDAPTARGSTLRYKDGGIYTIAMNTAATPQVKMNHRSNRKTRLPKTNTTHQWLRLAKTFSTYAIKFKRGTAQE